MDLLKHEIEKYTQVLIGSEWEEFSSKLTLKTASKREVIFRQTDVCSKVIYIAEGITASEYNEEGNKYVISRFFQRGNLCFNIISAYSNSI